MKIILALCVLLCGCGRQVKESNEAAIANQAESLERAANATTDQIIGDIENAARREEASAATATVKSANASQPR